MSSVLDFLSNNILLELKCGVTAWLECEKRATKKLDICLGKVWGSIYEYIRFPSHCQLYLNWTARNPTLFIYHTYYYVRDMWQWVSAVGCQYPERYWSTTGHLQKPEHKSMPEQEAHIIGLVEGGLGGPSLSSLTTSVNYIQVGRSPAYYSYLDTLGCLRPLQRCFVRLKKRKKRWQF